MASATDARVAREPGSAGSTEDTGPTAGGERAALRESGAEGEVRGDSNTVRVPNKAEETNSGSDASYNWKIETGQLHRTGAHSRACEEDIEMRGEGNVGIAADDKYLNINIDQDGCVSRDGSVSGRGSSRPPQVFGEPAEALERALARLGHFRLYQRYALLLLCVPNLLSAMYSLNYVFVADQVPFRCVIEECEGKVVTYEDPALQALLPADRCRRYAPAGPGCARGDHGNATLACQAFVYQNMDTIYAEFNLACNEWQRTLVGTVRNAALPLALILTGYISDGWGRRTAFCIFTAFAGALGIVKSFAPNYTVYLVMEFFEAALGYGFNSAAYVMMVELARPSLRAAFACATGVAYGLGGVLFALVASRVPYWRDLLRAIHAPALLLPVYWFILDESPRWLHAATRRDRAVRVIRKVARWNKITLDEDLLAAIADKKDEEKTKSEGNPWLSLIKSRVLMLRFLACSWCWVSATFVYYGLTINSVSLSGNKYTNFALNMAMEVVASLLIMMALERFGRRRSIFVAFLLCGLSCVIPYITSNARTGLGMFFVGKLAITFAFNSLYVFTAELFPTGARASALSAVSLVGRLGSVLAPQTPLLGASLQALLYGACSASAALAVLLAPETRRAPLPQHVRGAETLRAPDPLHVAT